MVHQPLVRATLKPVPRVGRLGGCYLAVLGAIGSLLGCKSNQRYDLIEAELRTRNQEVRELRCALEQAKILNHAYEQQLRAQQGILSSQARPPTTASGISVKQITLARGTGGYDEDGCPGDESLMVVAVPQDEDGSPIKVLGSLTVAAWQIEDNGLKTPIGQWEIPPEKLKQNWKTGLFNTGYVLLLPWQTFPTSSRIRVAVRLTTLDGQNFEADRDVSVRLLPPQQRALPDPSRPKPLLDPGTSHPAPPDPLPPPIFELPPPEAGELPPPQNLDR